MKINKTDQEHIARKRLCRDCGKPVTPKSYWFCSSHLSQTKEWDEENEIGVYFDRIRSAKKKPHS